MGCGKLKKKSNTSYGSINDDEGFSALASNVERVDDVESCSLCDIYSVKELNNDMGK